MNKEPILGMKLMKGASSRSVLHNAPWYNVQRLRRRLGGTKSTLLQHGERCKGIFRDTPHSMAGK